jgi:hypothetical protein
LQAGLALGLLLFLVAVLTGCAREVGQDIVNVVRDARYLKVTVCGRTSDLLLPSAT